MNALFLILACILCFASSQNCPPYKSQINKAWIRFIYNKGQGAGQDNGPEKLIINMTYSECYHCADRNLINITASDPSQNISYFQYSTEYSGTFFIYNQTITNDPKTNSNIVTNELLYTLPYDLKERGKYTFLITDSYNQITNSWSGLNIELITDEEGIDIFIPLYIAIGVLTGLVILYNLVLFLLSPSGRTWLRKIFSGKDYHKLSASVSDTNEKVIKIDSKEGEKGNQEAENSKGQSNNKGKETKQRLLSLDTFRGLSLAIMIFVNSGAGDYIELDHIAWNGLHLADLVFPWFVWMMGVSMAISFDSQQRRGASKKDMFKKVVVRTAKLALLDLILGNGNKPLNRLNFLGVLFRFAVSYFFVSVIIIFVPKNNKSVSNDSKNKDLIIHAYEFIPVSMILGLWLGLTFCLPVPGCPTGYLGPGGLADYGKCKNCTGGAAGYIDYQLVGMDRLYAHPTPYPVYLTQPYEPEGLLGCLTTIGMVYFGLMAGRVIIYYKTHEARIKRWLIAAVIFGIVSLILTGGSKNGGIMPVNKNLWSLSFITTLACFGLIVLSLLYTVIDIKKLWGGSPFKAMGMNSIVLYCESTSLFLSISQEKMDAIIP